MKPSQLTVAIKHAMLANRPVMIWSAPGIGKSEIIRQVGEGEGYVVNDNLRGSHTLPEDLRIPMLSPEGIKWAICKELAECHADETPRLIFIDELSAAAPSVQAIFYQLLGDHCTPDGRKLGDHVYLIGAGNRESDGAVAYKMPTALRSRLIHLDLEVDVNDWVDWANTHEIEPVVVAFIRSRPELLYPTFDKNARTFPCPRTWKYVSDVLTVGSGGSHNAGNQAIEHELVKGTVGEGAAVEFSAYLRLYRNLPDIDTILANPKTVGVPRQAGELYAVSAMVSRFLSLKTIQAGMVYLNRLPTEYNIMAVSDAMKRDKAIMGSKEWKVWAEKHYEVLV